MVGHEVTVLIMHDGTDGNTMVSWPIEDETDDNDIETQVQQVDKCDRRQRCELFLWVALEVAYDHHMVT